MATISNMLGGTYTLYKASYANGTLFGSASTSKKNSAQDSISALWSSYGSYTSNANEALSGLSTISSNVKSVLSSYNTAKSTFQSEMSETLSNLSDAAKSLEKLDFKVGTSSTTESIDANGNKVTATTGTDSKGNSFTSTSSIDAKGNPVTVTESVNSAGQKTTTTQTLDARGNTVTVTEGLDKRGNKVTTTESIDANGNKRTVTEGTDEKGNAVTITSGKNDAGESVTQTTGVNAYGRQVTTTVTSGTDENGKAYTNTSTVDSNGEKSFSEVQTGGLQHLSSVAVTSSDLTKVGTSTDKNGGTVTTSLNKSDLDDALKAVKNFVSAYNDTIDFFSENSGISKRVSRMAQVFGDTTYRAKSYESIGISVNSDGSLKVDEEKLTKAISDSPGNVSNILGKGGLAGKAESHISTANSQSSLLFPSAKAMLGDQLNTAAIYTGKSYQNITSLNNVGNLINMMF